MDLIIYYLLVTHDVRDHFGRKFFSVLIHIFSDLVFLNDYWVHYVVDVCLLMIYVAQGELESLGLENIEGFSSFNFVS